MRKAILIVAGASLIALSTRATIAAEPDTAPKMLGIANVDMFKSVEGVPSSAEGSRSVAEKPETSLSRTTGNAIDWLAKEVKAQGEGRMLPLYLPPYIIGLPYRMDAFEQLRSDLSARSDNWFGRGNEILDSL